MISKFNGTSTPKGSCSAKTGESTRKECYGSIVRTTLSKNCTVWAFAIRPSLNKMSDKTWYPGCATGRLLSCTPKKRKRGSCDQSPPKRSGAAVGTQFRRSAAARGRRWHRRMEIELLRDRQTFIWFVEQEYWTAWEPAICGCSQPSWKVSECYQSLTAHQHQKGHTVPKQVMTITTSIQVATV